MYYIQFSDVPFLEAMLRLLMVLVKYFLFAGTAYVLFYSWKKRDWWQLKIQQKMPAKGHIAYEIAWSVSSRLILGTIVLGIFYWIDMTKIYSDIATYGWFYFGASVLGLIFLHDTYFYWAHRLMHHPKLYRHMHKVHHHSTNPTPWASFSFHPSEALVEIAFFPLIIMLLPIHPIALLIVIMFQMFFNVYGHAGFELFPRYWVTHPVLKYLNTSTHHNLHHKEFHYNYGLYFNHWDRWCNTLDPQYNEKFLAVKDRKKEPVLDQQPLSVEPS